MPNPYAEAVNGPPPGLPSGIGTNDQATQVTAFIRQQPWYREWLAKNGLQPGEGDQVRLSKDQRKDLANLAVQHGIGLNNKFDQFDENGQVSEAHHKLKKVAIGAAIGGLALTGLGAAGIGPLAGAFGAGAGAAGAAGSATGGIGAGAAGSLAPIASTAGISSATALGLPVTAGLGTAGATAAGTAAGVLPVAAKVAGAEAAQKVATGGVKSWLTGNAGSLIDKGVQAGTGIWAANKAAGAAEDAAALQAKYYDEALKAERENTDYGRNQYADYLSRLDPYTQTGYGANDRIAQFGGQAVPNRPPPLQRPPMTSLPQGGASMVKLQAPDGSVQDVPADHVDHYVKLGAKPLQQ